MSRPSEHERRYKNVGRPTKITPDILRKLEDAFSNGLPDREACFYAGIANSTLYLYQARNPEFSERKQALRLHPNIAARKAIVAALGDVRVAQWWLEKKVSNEFGAKAKLEINGRVKTYNSPVVQVVKDDMQVAVKNFNEEMRKVLTTRRD